MIHTFLRKSLWHAVLVCIGLCIALTSRADVLSTVGALRAGGCGGVTPAVPALRHDRQLDQAAAAWAAGRTLDQALERSGYAAQASGAVHVTGPGASLMTVLRRSRCAPLVDAAFSDIGVHQQGADTWLVVAAGVVVPSGAAAAQLAAQALRLVNLARATGARCGSRAFGPAPPVRLSDRLDGVALGHAADMAEHGYFEHRDPAGRTPADRVRAAGYREKLVGENIAYGPASADEVVKGWLDSPGHCENIMDPRFSEMGLAYAQGRVGRHGLYWVQLLVAPAA